MARKKLTVNKSTLIIAVLILCISLLITLNENVLKLDFIPSWNDVYSLAGVNDGKVTDASVSVHFLDVDQGDCALIMTPKANILIDSGEGEYVGRVLSYLKAQGIRKLDYVIATHPHSDHIGGMAQILSNIDTDTLIMPKIQDSALPTTSVFYDMLEAIQDNNVNLEYAKSGKVYHLGEDCFLEILGPVNDYEDLNNYSIVSKFTHQNTTFLFTGDIEKQAETDLLDQDVDVTADVLSVPHHGSRTSSSKAFLLKVKPSYAVFSLGSPNSYGHPHDTIVERYSNLFIPMLRTDLSGNIVFESDGNNVHILTQKEAA